MPDVPISEIHFLLTFSYNLKSSKEIFKRQQIKDRYRKNLITQCKEKSRRLDSVPTKFSKIP